MATHHRSSSRPNRASSPSSHRKPQQASTSRPEVIEALESYEARCAAASASYRSPNEAFTVMSSREPLTVFHSSSYIVLPLSQLAAALKQHARCSDYDLLIAVVLCARYEATQRLPATRHMMHRLFVAALLASLKAHSDCFPRNKDYARIAGIDALELMRLEAMFIDGIGWRCTVILDSPLPTVGDAAPAAQPSTTRRLLELIHDTFSSSVEKFRDGDFSGSSCSLLAACSVAGAPRTRSYLAVGEPPSLDTTPVTTLLPGGGGRT
jgi:hypothetical protein